MTEELQSLEYTPTWVVAAVCSAIVLVSFSAERSLHYLGKWLKREKQVSLFEALQKLKEELMLLGFISFVLTASQGLISQICIPSHLASQMLPCKMQAGSHHQTISNNLRKLLSENAAAEHCAHKGKVPLLSLEALHQLHIFIFVLAVVHVIFCASTMVLGGAKIRQWTHWEHSMRSVSQSQNAPEIHRDHRHFFWERAIKGKYRKLPGVRWIRSFFKQFYGSVTKSDYIALRSGFIREHCPSVPKFNFHDYMLRTLEYDFKKIVGISWYLWLFVVIFLMLNLKGWNTYFWLSFLPLILLLLLGAKLEHIISRLAREVVERGKGDHDAAAPVKPSDEHFCFNRPAVVLYLIHFILFQNSFEIAFFIWVWRAYGFESCIMEKLGYIITRIIVGVIVQVLCSYSTLPLYALVTQMGSRYKQGIFKEHIQRVVEDWAASSRKRSLEKGSPSNTDGSQTQRMEKEPFGSVSIDEQRRVVDQGSIASMIELSCPNQNQMLSP